MVSYSGIANLTQYIDIVDQATMALTSEESPHYDG